MNDYDDGILLLLATACAALLLRRQRRRRSLLLQARRPRRRFWVRPFLREREEIGQYNVLLRELHCKDEQEFRLYFRMEVATFRSLYTLLRPQLVKQDTCFRKAISPRQRLALTIRFMGHGDSQRMLATEYCLGRSTVHKIITQTLPVIWRILQPLFMPVPTADVLRESEEGYRIMWNFPNCAGSIDGKHIQIQRPALSGSLYYAYTHVYSIVLMAVLGPTYKFLMIDVGQEGSQSDGGVFARCAFGQALASGTFPLPLPKCIGDRQGPMSHVFVGDEAFPLTTYMMRPYPRRCLGTGAAYRKKKIFNYRLSRARRVSENSFGILAQTWTIFFKNIRLTPRNATNLVKAACVLQNFLRDAEGSFHEVMQTSVLPNAQDELPLPLPSSFHQLPGLRHNWRTCAKDMRDRFSTFFSSPQGSVPNQDARAFGPYAT